ncbi:VWA domain-containing protein [Umezawaea sp. Da 62-37]|uniref:VWA domain-containing protein n=1 Tax=Umezawaea sp. Da 62-37 TaxID=3075927 RepID=UPI0028F72438|nr:VWA domain-containing protein [Umezawaea sp. Da 62-37]WNV83877.1 VWA domain-containing protein [Umezawaea sp. Da 62-37]
MASAALTAPAGHAQAAECAKVEIVTFRGSGEDSVDDGGRSNGLSGPTLQKIIGNARGLASASGYTLADVPVYGVPYPAIPAEEYADEDQDLFDSVEYGRLFGDGYIYKRRKECATTGTRFVLAGYSQGVIAAREVADDLPPGWIAGVFGVGDPAQKPNARGVTGTGANGDGIYRQVIKQDDGTASSDSFYDLSIPLHLFCHEDDPVCDYEFTLRWPPIGDFGPHTNYGGTDEELTQLAGVLRDMAETATTTPPPPDSTGAGPADLMFAIDTTGSMTPYLTAAVNSAKATADALRAATPHARVGLVEYRDHGDGYVARTVVGLTDDFASFEAGLRGLVADGGGDTPEAVYTGLVTALGADWDRSASRALIVLGDAPAHDPEPVTGLTASTVTEIAKGIAPMPTLPPTVGSAARAAAASPDVPGQQQSPPSDSPDVPEVEARIAAAPGDRIPPVAVYALSADSGLSTQLGPISAATGGAVFPIGSPDEVSRSIVQTVEDATTAPVARLKAAGTVIVGNKTVLSGLASSYSGTGETYAFDVDNDGMVEQSGTEGISTHTYTAPGPVDARLVVTDSRGRSSEAVVRIDVRPLESLQFPERAPSTTTTTSVPPTTSTEPSTPSTESSQPEVPSAQEPSSPGGLAFTGLGGLGTIIIVGAVLLGAGAGLFVVTKRRTRRSTRT